MNGKFSKNLEYILDNKLSTPQRIIEATGHKSTSIVTMWKNNERNIMPLDLLKIANLLGLTIDQLYNQDLRTVFSNENAKFLEYVKSYVDILTNDDKDTIRFLINKRIKK